MYRCDECGLGTDKPINAVVSAESCPRCSACYPPEAGFYARLSAPGYLDATDWNGPYPNVFRAMRALCDFYEVNTKGQPLAY